MKSFITTNNNELIFHWVDLQQDFIKHAKKTKITISHQDAFEIDYDYTFRRLSVTSKKYKMSL